MSDRLERLTHVANVASIPLNLMADLVNAAHATSEHNPKMSEAWFVESTLNSLVNGVTAIQVLMVLDMWRSK